MDESTRLVRQVKYFLKSSGKELPADAELKTWAENACVHEDFKFPKERGKNVYAIRLLPTSEKTRDKYGEALMQLCAWEDNKGKQHFGLSTYYHGTKTVSELGYKGKERFEKFSVTKKVGQPDFGKEVTFYPIISTKGRIVRELEAQGVLEFEEGERFNGSPVAVLTLPDETFCNVTHECFMKYVSMRTATMMDASMLVGASGYQEELEKRLGSKEYEVLRDHYHMLCDNAVKAVRVIEDSFGIAMLDHYLLEPEEKDFVNGIFDKHGMDVQPDYRLKFIKPISNVMKRNLLDEEFGAYNATALAHFLNNHGPMRRARERNKIREFSPARLRAITFGARDAQAARKAIRDSEEADGSEEE